MIKLFRKIKCFLGMHSSVRYRRNQISRKKLIVKCIHCGKIREIKFKKIVHSTIK